MFPSMRYSSFRLVSIRNSCCQSFGELFTPPPLRPPQQILSINRMFKFWRLKNLLRPFREVEGSGGYWVEMLINRVSRHGFCTVAARPWLFVGLGNPGDKFKGTRHNVGFEMIDAFAESQAISMDKVHFKAFFGQGFVGESPVLLAKPQTYMNLSGESTGPLAAYYKLPLNCVLVCHDDMGLPCGVLRLHHNGGHGSHNGLKSVIHNFRGNQEFARLRIGIGRPPGQMDPKAFLLQKFNTIARERIDTALQEGVEALKLVLSKGLTESARRFNTEQKYKHIRLQTLPT